MKPQTNPMIEAYRRFSPISDNVANELADIIFSVTALKGEVLLEIGKVARYFYFVQKGAARIYYIKDAEDVTDYFALENQFIGGVVSLFTGEPSNKAIEVLEDSLLYALAYSDFEQLCSKHHELERLGRKLATFGFIEGQIRMESIRFMSASERYHQLEARYPGISNRIPLKYIASYIGTSQVSLSRIRAGQQ